MKALCCAQNQGISEWEVCRLSPLLFVPLSPIRSASRRSTGSVYQRTPGFFFPLLHIEKLNDLGGALSKLPLASSWFKLSRHVLLFPLRMLHTSLRLAFPGCCLLCTAPRLLWGFPALSWVAGGQPGSGDRGQIPQ